MLHEYFLIPLMVLLSARSGLANNYPTVTAAQYSCVEKGPIHLNSNPIMKQNTSLPNSWNKCSDFCNIMSHCYYYVEKQVDIEDCWLYTAYPSYVTELQGQSATICKKEYANISYTNPGCDSESFNWIKDTSAHNVFDDNQTSCFNINRQTWIQVPNSHRSKWITIKSNVTTCAPLGGLSVYELTCDEATCRRNPCYAKAEENADATVNNGATSGGSGTGNAATGGTASAYNQPTNIECSFRCEITTNNRSLIIAMEGTGESSYYQICDSTLGGV